MTPLSTIQSWPREQLEDAFSQVEDHLAKALEAEKLARAGFDKAAAERESERNKVKLLAMGQETFLQQIESLKSELTAHTQALKVAKDLLRYVTYLRLPLGDTVFDHLDFERQATINNLLK